MIDLTTIELLPCPFCGENPVIKRHSGDYGYTPPSVSISCMICNIHFSKDIEKWVRNEGHVNIEKESVDEIVNKWNTRS